ncbi:MAG: Ig-like domain-containing protein, partial [Candidatus Aegiribacteria sp.]|nr:Ig-like domain-containing protein [Candidatus Aegiribacteria sp.]
PDSMTFFGIDSLPADSLRLRSYYPAPGSENVNPAGPYSISFNFWVDLDSLKNRLTLIRVSDSTLIQGTFNRIDGRSFEFIPNHQLIGEQQYRFMLLKGISTAWGDTLLSSFSWSFSTAWGDEPGSIEGDISGMNVPALVLQISRTGGGSDESVIYTIVQPGQYKVDEIPAGRYTVAAFVDNDGDGTWSSMEPYGTYPGVVLVQPGLITQEVDIEILP